MEATTKQVNFLQKLANSVASRSEGEFADHVRRSVAQELEGGISKSRASALIERLIVLRDELTADEPKLDISGLDGYYAVPDPADGALRFIRVRRPGKDSRWNGWAFVDVQASDDFHGLGKQSPGGQYQGRSGELIAAILADPEAALLRYGQEIGRCGHCGRTLTNEESRQRGIGPICAEALGL